MSSSDVFDEREGCFELRDRRFESLVPRADGRPGLEIGEGEDREMYEDGTVCSSCSKLFRELLTGGEDAEERDEHLEKS